LLTQRAASPFAAIARERWRELGGGGAALAYDELAGLSAQRDETLTSLGVSGEAASADA